MEAKQYSNPGDVAFHSVCDGVSNPDFMLFCMLPSNAFLVKLKLPRLPGPSYKYTDSTK